MKNQGKAVERKQAKTTGLSGVFLVGVIMFSALVLSAAESRPPATNGTAGSNVAGAVAMLSRNANVDYAEPNYPVHVAQSVTLPNRPGLRRCRRPTLRRLASHRQAMGLWELLAEEAHREGFAWTALALAGAAALAVAFIWALAKLS